MNKEKVIEILFGIALLIIIAFFTSVFLFLILPPRVHFENKLSTTCTIPATEWKCEINTQKEITCKGVMK